MIGPPDIEGSSRQDEDAPIVARVRAGDVDAYAILVSRYRDAAVRYAYRMLGDLSDAEDVTQDAFIRAYRSVTRDQEPVRFEAWLFKILVNRCRTAAARRSRRRKLFVEDHLGVDRWAAQQAQDSRREGETDFEMDEELDRAMARLNDAQREAFLLKHVNEMTYEDMATLTGTPIPALKMRVSRACETLRACLAEVYHVS
ncbi:MAG TPA: sigma-70 family RNA polymerase sigma factor [Gemmatimonadaceae bacterium]|jgi:RNA polymerase sigma-70 factor (ECF subfamily)|nr:sigma-70 family RNA polymerase sigma factor [Gemmatimonadaceae bacterium]